MARQPQYGTVDAEPVKSFFVKMLTRDIKLEDAILDLLDNCIDGILRSKHAKGKKPYKGFFARIDFGKDSFSISDNCGGIPWKDHKYAFRMGRSDDRPDDVPGTVGAYGIGMKRAIFKMGKECLISTQSGNHRYEVEITPDWIESEDDWNIPVHAIKEEKEFDGTTILVGSLHDGIRERFDTGAKAFMAELMAMVSTHYAFIIDKGFEVTINDIPVIPSPTKLVFDDRKMGIKPYIFKATIDEVEVFLCVGLTRPIPSQDEADSDQEEKKYSSLDAGWTVLCNDRAVLYCDRTELTGWGEAGVPRYHTQFIAISGIVEFKSKGDPSKLPTTTTKRGIEGSSILYLQVKNKMREGMELFTEYTNKWKKQNEEAKKHIEGLEAVSLDEIKAKAASLAFKPANQLISTGKVYKPTLPVPEQLKPTTRRITYTKDIKDIERVTEHLFDDESPSPSIVGEKCFDIILQKARQ